MLRIFATAVVVTTAIHTLPGGIPAPTPLQAVHAMGDVRALLAETAEAPPILCALAARAVDGGGWFRGSDVPVHPLSASTDGSLHGIGHPLPPTDVPFVLEQLTVGNDCARELAVRLLAQDQSSAAIDGLEARLTSDDADLAAAAAFGLGLVAKPRSLEPLRKTVGNPLIAPRVNALWALGRLGLVGAYHTVVAALEHPDARVRLAATGALGRIDTSAAEAALISRLGRDDDARVRRTAAWALGQREATTGVDALGEALRRDGDPGVREMSAWAIGAIDHSGADDALLDAARHDADATVRETAVWALGVRGDRANAPAVGELLATERASAVRQTAAWAIGVMRPASSPRSLITALGDVDPGVRRKAAWAVSEIRDSAVVSAVSSALARETDETTRRALLRALLRSGAAESQLTALLDSPDAKDRQMVARALAGQSRIDPWPWPMPRPRPFP